MIKLLDDKEKLGVWVGHEIGGFYRGSESVVLALAYTGLAKSQRWGMKGRAMPSNPPDKTHLVLLPTWDSMPQHVGKW